MESERRFRDDLNSLISSLLPIKKREKEKRSALLRKENNYCRSLISSRSEGKQSQANKKIETSVEKNYLRSSCFGLLSAGETVASRPREVLYLRRKRQANGNLHNYSQELTGGLQFGRPE